MTGATLAPVEFDPTVPVTEGITVLEASAGTGKTHAASSLVVAEVARGRPLDQLLVVTFTNKASGELRERVRQRLSDAADALAPGAVAPGPEADRLLTFLWSGDEGERTLRRQRLRTALSGFDAATIETIHGFAKAMLDGLGVAGDSEPDLELAEDISQLVDDAVRDLYLRRIHEGREIPFSADAAREIAHAVVDHPDCRIAEVDEHEVDIQRLRLAKGVRRRVEAQKRAGRLITYDDLLARLATSLADPARGHLVAERLRSRFTMAVVDEFQDTDPVQWHILQGAFGEPPTRLVLVGDPKQAIYAFRGGDVFAYLDATVEAKARHPEAVQELRVSWRADQPLLDAFNAFFGEAQLGDASIRYRPLTARPGAETSKLSGPDADAPFAVRIARRDGGQFEVNPSQGTAKAPSVRRFIAADLAGEAVRMLQETTIDGHTLHPSDLAVLVRARHEATPVRDALHAVGVPAVVHASGSVLASETARDWLELLVALEQPTYAPRVHAVALGPFVGWDATRLAAADDRDREHLDDLLHDWAVAARSQGIAGLVRRVEAGTGLTGRLLATVGGERRLSDLRHLAELLHARQASAPGSLAALAAWLREEMASVHDSDDEAGRRRLESDADAVAIHTIHGAKGLEFPVVLLPGLWSVPRHDEHAPATFHDDERRRALSVGAGGPLREWQADRALAERDQEDLRLLYVALTRAKHRVVVWWATASESERSPVARVLLGQDEDGAVRRRLQQRPDEDEVADAFATRGIAVADATGGTDTHYTPALVAVPELAAARFDRTFDDRWVRTSYSGLTRVAHESGPHVTLDLASRALDDAADLDEAATIDEPPLEAVRSAEGALAEPVALAEVPGSARIGTLVHDVLEHTDFAAPDLAAALAAAATDAGASRILDGFVPELLAGLVAAIETPLGPGFGGHRLRDLTRADRLDELAFDLPMAGGNRPHPGLLTMDAIADVFATLPADDPLATYHERLRDPLLATRVRGFLSGSIDLVARIGERHVVVDYKTNTLAPPAETLTSWHYRPEALAEAMADAHYPLQAALYAVAVHRFLRWRIPAYDPARHLGGVAYLFLRGMTGPDTPCVDGSPCGVFAWQPSAAFVTALSDVIDRGVA